MFFWKVFVPSTLLFVSWAMVYVLGLAICKVLAALS